MKRLLYASFGAVLLLTLWTIGIAGADHDMVYAPCDPEDPRPLYERVWYLDYQSGEALRFDDPWWAERVGAYTNWGHQCTLGTAGVWQAAPILPLPHPPTHTVETRPPTTTTTTTTTTEPPATTTTVAPTTTTEPVATTTAPPTTTTVAPATDLGDGIGLPDGYDLFTAEFDGWPFQETIILLEDRYPQGTSGKYHFRLSVAVEFLREGGLIGGLDNVWNSG